MKKNRLKEIWAAGDLVTLGWLHIPNSWSAEIMAHAGWDAVTVDMQHGLHNLETAVQLLQAISTTTAVPLARANWNEPGHIMRLLDSGAYGIICPMVNTQEECEQFVGACRYPPAGYRSFGPTRPRISIGATYGDHANTEVLTIAMVETKEAVENIEAITAVPGLDGIFVGSGDLRLSLTGSVKKGEQEHLFDQAIDKILRTCQQYKIQPGVWCANPTDAATMQAKGYRFIALSSDSLMLNSMAKAQAQALNALKIQQQ
ncbi:MAG: aldolase/citrate lyase family protein [Bacteroidota bacterium]